MKNQMNQFNFKDEEFPDDPYIAWDMDRPEPGEDDPFEDMFND